MANNDTKVWHIRDIYCAITWLQMCLKMRHKQTMCLKRLIWGTVEAHNIVVHKMVNILKKLKNLGGLGRRRRRARDLYCPIRELEMWPKMGHKQTMWPNCPIWVTDGAHNIVVHKMVNIWYFEKFEYPHFFSRSYL